MKRVAWIQNLNHLADNWSNLTGGDIPEGL